jgi:hypothetical protein
MDDLYKLLDRIGVVSPFDTFLLIIIFFLARQRYLGLIADLKCARERIRRLERSVQAQGIELGEIEEE